MAALPIPSPGALWRLARKAEDLFKLQTTVEASLKVIEEWLRTLEDRMLQLESDQRHIINEARNAATLAASTIASAIASEAATRITRLELRTEQLEQQRLPPT